MPVLVDSVAIEAERLTEAVESVAGVRSVPRVRSRWIGSTPAVDVVVHVAPELSTVEGHAIADEIERVLEARFEIQDVTVHLEPGE